MDSLMFENRKLQVLDGGLATELISDYNHTEIHNDPLWSSRIYFTNPDHIEKVHEKFLLSGADIIATCTYQASIESFSKTLNISSTVALNIITDACKLCVNTRNKFWEKESDCNKLNRMKPLVGGSLGPFGACIPGRHEYSGKYVDNMSMEQLVDWHNKRVGAVIDGGVDICLFETIPALKEAKAICQVMKDYPSMPACISFSCQDDKSTCYGDDVTSIIDEVAAINNIVAIGINCVKPKYCSSLISKLRNSLQSKNIDKFIVVYPDSGEIWNQNNTWTKPADWRPVSDYVEEWVKAGANWIGGCCRVTAEDISKIKQKFETMPLLEIK